MDNEKGLAKRLNRSNWSLRRARGQVLTNDQSTNSATIMYGVSSLLSRHACYGWTEILS